MTRSGIPLFALLCLLAGGCASPNVNPPTPRTHKGYADFYADNDTELSWQVKRLNSQGREKKVFSEFNPLEDEILRLAFEPGRYRFSIVFINRPIIGPGTVEIEVKDGMVTPICVTLVDAGTGQIRAKEETRLRPTAHGRFGRGTTITSYETQLLRVQAVGQEPLPYRIKSEMPYAIDSNQEVPQTKVGEDKALPGGVAD